MSPGGFPPGCREGRQGRPPAARGGSMKRWSVFAVRRGGLRRVPGDLPLRPGVRRQLPGTQVARLRARGIPRHRPRGEPRTALPVRGAAQRDGPPRLQGSAHSAGCRSPRSAAPTSSPRAWPSSFSSPSGVRWAASSGKSTDSVGPRRPPRPLRLRLAPRPREHLPDQPLRPLRPAPDLALPSRASVHAAWRSGPRDPIAWCGTRSTWVGSSRSGPRPR